MLCHAVSELAYGVVDFFSPMGKRGLLDPLAVGNQSPKVVLGEQKEWRRLWRLMQLSGRPDADDDAPMTEEEEEEGSSCAERCSSRRPTQGDRKVQLLGPSKPMAMVNANNYQDAMDVDQPGVFAMDGMTPLNKRSRDEVGELDSMSTMVKRARVCVYD